MEISTRELRAFLTLAEESSFTRAAALCHLSQPAFSSVIKSLEDMLGMRLFDRSTRHVELTPEGRDFAVSARRVMSEFEDAMVTARESSDRKRGFVSIALLPSLAASWLPGVMAKFNDAYPGIQVDVRDILSEGCIDEVRTRKADFCIAARQSGLSDLRSQAFCSDEFHLVCPRKHPLAAVKSPKPRDLTGHAFIHLSRTSSVRQILDVALYPNQMKPAMEVEHMATVLGMVRAGRGVSIVPSYSLFYFHHEDLCVTRLPWKGLTRQIDLFRRSDRQFSLAAQSFYDFVLQHRP